jgi:exodeoxyribonuclease VII large subunit
LTAVYGQGILVVMQYNLFNPDMQGNRYWTVTSITHHIKDWIDSDVWLQDCWVQGEISNFSRPSSGHIYFTLKDSSAQIRCVMWRTQAARLKIPIHDGQQVEVHGQVTVYEASGQYQIIADSLQLSGEGLLYQEFLRLKSRLEGEGVFDPSRKRALPERPAVIGIITSPTGAAIQDMVNTIARRYPIAQVILAPAQVQGEEAPASILLALQALIGQSRPPEVILLARGGGSIEDLWAFNDERVVRAVANSPIPIVTGVGHETDFTLVDFASDLRAPTPTAAAELATPNQADLRMYHLGLVQHMAEQVGLTLRQNRQDIQRLRMKLDHYSPSTFVNSNRQYCDQLIHRLDQSVRQSFKIRRLGLAGLSARLGTVSPLAVLDRGYSIVQAENSGQVVRSVHQVHQDDPIRIRTGDGVYSATVK